MVKKSKKENLCEHQLDLSSSLIRLELKSGPVKPSVAFSSSIPIIFKEISVEFVLILYEKMTLEISCRAIYFIEDLSLIVIIYDEYLQLIRLDASLNFVSTKSLNCCITGDCIISLTSDMIVISKLNKLILYSKLPK